MINPYTLTKEQYQELYKEVLTFSKIGGVVADEDNLWKMCDEEFINELLPAIEAEDKLKVIDGNCDSWVTIIQLHNHYMSKPSWELPYPRVTYATGLYELEEMIEKQDPKLVHNALNSLIQVSRVLAKEYGYNLYKAIKEVNRSNMTKFPKLGQFLEFSFFQAGPTGLQKFLDNLAKKCEEESNGKYKDVVCNISDYSFNESKDYRDIHLVFRADGGKGKVAKFAPLYEEPNFEECWV